MLRGLPASIAFHAAVLGAGYVAWPYVSNTEGRESELVIVPIELIELGEINNIVPVIEPEPETPPEDEEPAAEEEEAPEPENEEPLPEEDVDETLPEDEIEQTQESAPPEETEPEDVVPDLTPDPVTEPEDEEPEPEPEPKAPVQRQNSDFDDFLNQADSTFQSERETRRKRPEPKPQPKPLLEDTPPQPQTPRHGAGERTASTARLEALLYSYVRPCWTGVDDLPNPENLNVRMSAELDENGNLNNLRLVEPARRPVGRQPMGIAVDRALRAVRKCAPYKLPRDDYSEWRDIKINLGPAFAPD